MSKHETKGNRRKRYERAHKLIHPAQIYTPIYALLSFPTHRSWETNGHAPYRRMRAGRFGVCHLLVCVPILESGGRQVKFWVGVTDNGWYSYLAERQPDEVNFWRPKSTAQFRAIAAGGLFLFKLHSPLNFIAGGGFFLRHSVLPLSLAWEAFGNKNGADDIVAFREHIWSIRRDRVPDRIPDRIG